MKQHASRSTWTVNSIGQDNKYVRHMVTTGHLDIIENPHFFLASMTSIFPIITTFGLFYIKVTRFYTWLHSNFGWIWV